MNRTKHTMNATKRTAPKCANCGRYQVHEDLTAVNTDDGVVRICPDCLDDKVGNGNGQSWKALHKSQWAKAVERMDEIIDRSHISLPPQDALAKARGQERLSKAFDNAMAYLDSMAVAPRRNAPDRVAQLVKAERTKRETAQLRKETKRIKKKTKAAKLRKSQALQKAADIATEAAALQAEMTAHVDDIAKRVNRVVANAERAYGAITRQRDIQRTAELARQDQLRADWNFKAGQTSDPDIRRYYVALAAGEDPDAIS
jgi:hypothetical protein